ncbi:hypothetical protein ACWGB8_12940 [Kitasatospora sp. NPDC054939]
MSESVSGELRRIRDGASDQMPPQVLAAIEVTVDQGVSPSEYLARVKAVLAAAVSMAETSDFDSEELPEDSIPGWFADVSREDANFGELAGQIAIRAARRYQESHDEDPWELQEWLFSFDPERRPWAWWDGVVTQDKVVIWVDTNGEPVIASHNLRWLVYVAGAVSASRLDVQSSINWIMQQEYL